MRTKKSAIVRRKEEINKQVAELRGRLSSKSRQDFTTDFRYQNWIKESQQLINILLDELSCLEDPGEYDELPAAVVADELGLSLKHVRSLIKLGEIEATGKQAHERIGRRELERLVLLSPTELNRLADTGVDDIFREAVSSLRSGDIVSTERTYRRLKARETCIGERAISVEIALKLARGQFEGAERTIKFVLREKFDARNLIGSYLLEFLRGVYFKSPEARKDILRSIKPLVNETWTNQSDNTDDLQLRAMYITTIINDFIFEQGSTVLVCYKGELHRSLVNGIYTALAAETQAQYSQRSQEFIVASKLKMPLFWEPATLPKELHEQT